MTRRPPKLAAALIAERPRTVYKLCPWCGRPCRGPACMSHRDLHDLEQALYRGQPSTSAEQE